MEMSSYSLVFSTHQFAAGLSAVCGLDGAAGESLQKALIMEGISCGDMIKL